MCEKCLNKTCLKTGKPCDDVEKIMREEGIMSIKYIRKTRETPMGGNHLDKVSIQQALKLKYGKRKGRGGSEIS